MCSTGARVHEPARPPEGLIPECAARRYISEPVSLLQGRDRPARYMLAMVQLVTYFTTSPPTCNRQTMTHKFRRTGELKDMNSYPAWLQRVVHDTARDKARVVEHELFTLMRDAKLPLAAMKRFLIGVWPTIEQFPRFMSMNLKKVSYGGGAGGDMGRRYPLPQIRRRHKAAEDLREV